MLVVLSMAFISASALSPSGTYTADPSADEYEVYSDLIDSHYVREGVNLIVIEDQTDPESGGIRELHGIDGDLLEDYQAKNRISYDLKGLLNLDVDYELIGECEAQDLLSEYEKAWDEFYSNYPGSQGILVLSRVGFNRDKNQALVYASNQAGPDELAGNYYLLERDGPSWTVKDIYEAPI
jgi:hypothetical protein